MIAIVTVGAAVVLNSSGVRRGLDCGAEVSNDHG